MSSYLKYLGSSLFIIFLFLFCFHSFAKAAISGCLDGRSGVAIPEISRFNTDNPNLHASLYVPAASHLQNPAPLLVLTHGWADDRCGYLDNEMLKKADEKGWILLAPAYTDQDGVNNTVDNRWLPSHVPSLASVVTQKGIIDAVNYVKNRYQVDNSKVYISGNSMGGETSVIMAAKYPDVFAAAIDWFGITNLSDWISENREVFPAIDDNDPRLNFTGNWVGQPIRDTSNDYTRVLNSAGSVSFTFTGNWMAYVSSLGPYLGKASISIDNGKFSSEKDLYNPTRIFGIYNYFPNLGAGQHTITVSWTGNKNNNALGTNISFDGFDYGNNSYIPQGVIDDSDRSINYVGTWQTQTENTDTQPLGSLIQGSVHVTSDPNAYVEYNFSGTNIGLIHTVNKYLGKADIIISNSDNGVIEQTVQLDMGPTVQYYSDNTEDKYYHVVNNRTFRYLSSGNHKIKIKPVAGATISIDGFIFGNDITTASYRHFYPMTIQSVGPDPSLQNFEYARRSPVVFASNLLNTDLKIVHSSRDSVVRQSQGKQLSDAIKSQTGKDVAVEDPPQVPGHTYDSVYRANTVFNYFQDKTLIQNPNHLKVTTDESKSYFWIDIQQTGGNHFTKVDITKDSNTGNFSVDTVDDQSPFTLIIDLSKAEMLRTTYHMTDSAVAISQSGDKISLSVPQGHKTFQLLRTVTVSSATFNGQGLNLKGMPATVTKLTFQNGPIDVPVIIQLASGETRTLIVRFNYTSPITPTLSPTSTPTVSPLQSDDFETDLSKWIVKTDSNNSAGISTEQKQSGNKSLKLAYTGTGAMVLSDEFSTPRDGTVSIWFYDDMSPKGTLAGIFNQAEDQVVVLGVNPSTPGYYYYRAGTNVPNGGMSSRIARSSGWHKFEFVATPRGSYGKIDGISLSYLNNSGISKAVGYDLTQFSKIKIASTWGVVGNSYYDNLTLTDLPSLPSVLDREKHFVELFANQPIPANTDYTKQVGTDTRGLADKAFALVLLKRYDEAKVIISQLAPIAVNAPTIGDDKDFAYLVTAMPLSMAAWLSWDSLDSTTQQNIRTLITREANLWTDIIGDIKTNPNGLQSRLKVSYTTWGCVSSPCKNIDVISGFKDDTKSEENTWKASFLAMASTMFPDDPNAPNWDLAGRTFAYHSYTTGAIPDSTYNGITSKTMFYQDPGFIDYTVGNHGWNPHITYALGGGMDELTRGVLFYQKTGKPIPDEFKHNILKVWDAQQPYIDKKTHLFRNIPMANALGGKDDWGSDDTSYNNAYVYHDLLTGKSDINEVTEFEYYIRGDFNALPADYLNTENKLVTLPPEISAWDSNPASPSNHGAMDSKNRFMLNSVFAYRHGSSLMFLDPSIKLTPITTPSPKVSEATFNGKDLNLKGMPVTTTTLIYQGGPIDVPVVIKESSGETKYLIVRFNYNASTPTPTSIPTPTPTSISTNLSATCSTPGTTANLSWNSVSGATSYNLFISTAGHTYNWTTCDAPNICKGPITATSYNLSSLVPGTSYQWYIASCNSSGCGTAVAGPTFICATALTSTPTPSNTPTQTPVPTQTPIPTPVNSNNLLQTDMQSGSFDVPQKVQWFTGNDAQGTFTISGNITDGDIIQVDEWTPGNVFVTTHHNNSTFTTGSGNNFAFILRKGSTGTVTFSGVSLIRL